MQQDWFVLATLLTLVVLFLLFGVVALRKARARRQAAFAEDTTPRPPAPELPPEALRRPEALREAADEAIVEERIEAAEADAEQAVAAEEQEAEQTVAPTRPPAPVVDAALQAGLAKTQASFLGRINQIFSRHPQVDAAVLDELEEVLLTADVGVGMATRFIDELRGRLKAKELASAGAVRDALRDRMLKALAPSNGQHGDPLQAAAEARPRIILFVGVNGVGKTTTIGKIAAQLRARGDSVLLAAGDTFRAAAAEQLAVWGERTGARVVRGAEGADPASVMFNAVEAAKGDDIDVVLADTAGRLHTKTELMDEIRKVKRAVSKARAGAPDETWLVVDATTGQNALQQAREFHQALGLTGVILTKLDGTAKGGVVVGIVDTLKIPVRFIGVGEKADDLRPFNPQGFISALFEGAAIS
jgi:fused signal recognition particle receptor